RAFRDGVTDFIAIGPWPPFNVADIGVTAGAILLVTALVLSGGDG
ncbi:MAG: signal peptidase II, partial [Thermoleophilia bacterium]|nr:signal peptidase II [Thermoleophilia bacterium]